jgi:hypothetical protein
VSQLVRIISAPESRDDDNGPATDNAISSIGKICLYQADKVDAAALLPQFVNWLPLEHDQEEATKVHKMLCQFIARY